MPRSHLKVNRWRTLCALLTFAVFVSLMLAEAGAQGTQRRIRSQLQQNTAAAAKQQQARRKSIASVRSFDTSDGSRVIITSDVPLNDYAAFWSGDRYYVVIPEADLVARDTQTLQSSLRGQGFQDVRIEKKGDDVVISFRLRAGMRARVEQKFNRLDVLFTAPPGAIFNTNQNPTIQNRNTGAPIFPRGTGGQQGNFSGTSSRGTNISSTGTSGGASTATRTASSTGGGGGERADRGLNRRGSFGTYNYGYRGGGDRGGGAPLNIPLPSAEQPEATPEGTATAAPSASSSTSEGTAATSATPLTSESPTPEQLAQNEPQQPVTAPPSTSTTTTTAPQVPATTETSFAAAVKENWLPLLIGLLVLLAIGLLLVSRSRAEGSEERRTERIETKKSESLKESPAARTDAKLVGGVAGAAAGAAVAKESRAKAAPAKETEKEEVKGIESVAPPVEMERVSSEVKSLLEGKDYDEGVISSSNPETRQIISTELMAALASRNPERQLRAREAFTKHGFFDEATRRLRTAEAPAERISAARALGLTQDRAATPHLNAALEDDDPEVRRAAVNALSELRDPAAIGPLNALLEREKNRKVPHSLIRRAIESSATIDVQQPSAASTSAPAAETKDAAATAAEKKDKDDDREVFEI